MAPGLSVRTIRGLFTGSGNRCTFPGCTRTLVDAASGIVTGEICHIRVQSEGGPRYDAKRTDEERHGFGNLVPVCVDHHKVIDAAPETYTVEGLERLKAEHERAYAGDHSRATPWSSSS